MVVLSIYFAYSYINCIQFKLNPYTSVTTGFLVDYDKNPARRSTRWAGIYEFHVDEETYRCTSAYRTRYKSNIDEKMDIYYNQSNPYINQASNNANDNLFYVIICFLVTIFLIWSKKTSL